jgi:molecular chaperone DnaJ
MAEKDYYSILGVSETATPDEIKKKFRQLAKTYHPDKTKGDKSAEDKFKDISEAYEVLSDPEKKRQYDQLRMMRQQGYDFGGAGAGGPGGQRFTFNDASGGFGGFEDVFSSFFDRGQGFGAGRRARAKGQDVVTDLEITFEQSVSGGQIPVVIPVHSDCTTCNGSGAQPGSEVKTCPRCGGSGSVTVSEGAFALNRPCPECFGEGNIITNPCKTCGGTGRVPSNQRLTITVPAGATDGTTLRLSGLGEKGPAGAPPGDLLVRLRVKPHRFFKRKGYDIYCKVPISMVQAALGTKIKVRTVDGRCTIKVPAGTQSGTKLRLSGRGIAKPSGIRGDQYVEIVVKVPKKLTDKQKTLLEEFQKAG